jgi:hypothetical protein
MTTITPYIFVSPVRWPGKDTGSELLLLLKRNNHKRKGDQEKFYVKSGIADVYP